ncbi:MAG: hypothetical protein HYS57_02640 [Parcubacteria group bacterium]|nr:hypothetical protein [Parcubacteria group bacterium]
MKAILLILAVGSFIALGVFGFVAMGENDGLGHGRCVAAMARGIDCPPGSNLVDVAAFHLNAFRVFSNAVFGDYALGAFLFSFVLVLSVAVIHFLAGSVLVVPVNFLGGQRLRFSEILLPSTRALARWLALHENSPSFT